MSISINGAVVLVTGANGGLGRQFVQQSLDRGAAKVYATARTLRSWNDPRIHPLTLDVTDETSIAAAAAGAADTTVVINNAGVISAVDSLATGDVADFRRLFETNFFGAVNVVRGFAPVLEHNGGGVFLDVHSVVSWVATGGAYSASKAAFWSATNSLRVELAARGIEFTGLHMGYVDTAMTEGVDSPQSDPADIVREALDGLEAGLYEVLADDITRAVKQNLAGPIQAMYPQLTQS